MSLLDKEKYTRVKCMDILSSTMANMSSAASFYELLKYFSHDVLTIHFFKCGRTASVVHFLALTSLAPWLAC